MSDLDDQWCKLVEQKLFQLECKQAALRGLVVYLGERMGISVVQLLALQEMSEKAVYQKRLERLEQISPETAVRLDAREDEEVPVMPEDFGLDPEWVKRLDELFGNDGKGDVG